MLPLGKRAGLPKRVRSPRVLTHTCAGGGWRTQHGHRNCSFFLGSFFFFNASSSSQGGFSAHFAQCSYAPVFFTLPCWFVVEGSRRSEWRTTGPHVSQEEPLRIMSTFDFACSGSGTPSRKHFAKSLVTFVFLPAQFRTLSCYTRLQAAYHHGSLWKVPLSPTDMHFRRKRSRMPLHQLQLFFLKTPRSLNFEPEPHLQHEDYASSVRSQHKISSFCRTLTTSTCRSTSVEN